MVNHILWRSILRESTREEECRFQPLSAICAYLTARSHTPRPEVFFSLLTECKEFINAVFKTDQPNDIILGIQALEDTLTIKHVVGDEFLKDALALLCEVVETSDDTRVTERAAAAVGLFFAKSGGTFSHDVATRIVWALKCLGRDSKSTASYTRLNAVILLKSIAEHAPAAFNIHVQSFLDLIWNGLTASEKDLRIVSAEAVGACLRVIEQRTTRNRVIWFNNLLRNAQSGLRLRSDAACVHGCLMVIAKLMQHSGEFMLACYEEVTQLTLSLRLDVHEVTIQILQLIPLFADFFPERFVKQNLTCAMSIILSISRENRVSVTAEEAVMSFRSLKGLALSLYDLGQQLELMRWMTEIVHILMNAFELSYDVETHQEALECCGVLATCLKSAWKSFAESLLYPMTMTGISHALARCLQRVAESIPELTTSVQERLLDVIFLLLIDKPFSDCVIPELWTKIRESRSSQTVKTALEVLSSFNFDGQSFLDVALDHVCSLLTTHASCKVRGAAVVCCVQIAKQHAHASSTYHQTSIQRLLEKLIIYGMSDSGSCVRYAVWNELLRCPQLDKALLNSNASYLLFIGLGDISVDVQFVALKLAGRLIPIDDGSIWQTVMEWMMQLLQQLEYSFDKERNQISTQVLSQLIQSCPSVVEPRSTVICKSLIHLLKRQLQPPNNDTASESSQEGQSTSVTWLKERFSWTSTGVVAAALNTVGHLADQLGSCLDPQSLQTLMELTVAALQKVEIETDSIEAVRTLGKLVSSTGAVTQPYHQFAWLLPRLLDMLQVDDVEVRMAVTRTLGILGAISPSTQRRIQAQASGEGRLELEGVRPIHKCQDDVSTCFGAGHTTDKGATDLLFISSIPINSEESYSLFAMNALLKVLKQHSLSTFHRGIITVLGSITSSLSVTSVQYLNVLVPNWCEAVYSGDEDLKQYILEQFMQLVRVVGQHIRHFLKNLMKLVQDLWTENCSEKTLFSLLQLLKEVASICRHDLHLYFSWLIPRIVCLLQTEAWNLVPTTLQVISALGPSLEKYLHLILPTVSSLLLSRCLRNRGQLRKEILSCIDKIGTIICPPELTGVVLVPLLRILHRRDGADYEQIADSIASVIYSTRPSDSLLSRLNEAFNLKGVRSQKLALLMDCIPRRQEEANRPLDIDSSWRRSFERPELSLRSRSQDEQRRRNEPFSDRRLRKVWNAEQVYTYQDWIEWMRAFSLELLQSSPSPALRACHSFAQSIPSMTKDLFSASFVSCWSQLERSVQRELIRHLEAAMASKTIPPEILTTLLNLAEFMEHNNCQLPLDKRTLAALSTKCQAFAKALHYKEMEFQENPRQAVENMLAIYNQCFLPAAAEGLLAFSRRVLYMQITSSWYEKLHKWDIPLEVYETECQRQLLRIGDRIKANLGRMRCYSGLWDWSNLMQLCRDQWSISDPAVRKQIAPLAAQAAWKMGQWDEMSRYLEAVDVDEGNISDLSTCAFLYSVSKIQQHAFDDAQRYIDKARLFISADLAALSSESYERAYEKMIRVQQLAELEEVMQVIQSQEKGDYDRRRHIVNFWKTRLDAVQRRADVWESCLTVRRLVLDPQEDILTWMKFAAMCRKQDKVRFAKSLLLELLDYDPAMRSKEAVGYGGNSGNPEVMFGYLKHIFGTSDASPDQGFDAMERLTDMIQKDGLDDGPSHSRLDITTPSVPLVSRAYVALAKWQQTLQGSSPPPEKVEFLIELSRRACIYAPDWAKAWRDWAVFHLIAVEYYNSIDSERASEYVAPAVRGFFTALKLSQDSALHGGMLGSGPSKDTYQDILRLLTLWFNYGNAPNVREELTAGFNDVRIETWIVVIPQIIARIDMKLQHVQDLIHHLLKRIGKDHPQALLYPILVASYNANGERRTASLEALELMRVTHPIFVSEGELIGRELVDTAVFWDEKWYEGLEEASKHYFTDSNIQHMLDVLLPLHQDLQRLDPRTNSERAFVANYAEQLNKANELLLKYLNDEDETAIQKAWDIYYSVFRKIDANIRDMLVLHLRDVAPDLLDRSMSVAIPGTYCPFQTEQVCIDRIVPEIQILNTKQHPRKLTIEGNDGNCYVFLLKGHEDLRQDERVMQLFGLVNTILDSDFAAAERELSIARYAVTPLSPNVGLIGWVPNCDTLHALIKEYRDGKSILINAEHQMMKNFAPYCENLTVIQKVEVFRHALDCTAGDDLKKIMWIKSSSSEHWLAHRTNYIRSCAVMSIVGYILGLGDRHPSNLMIDRYSGKLVHIDFGDCFEAGMNREKFPEKVPFRLTRMMVKAMEVTGVEGTFKNTCEMVMHVLRAEKQTVMAMLEAFVYDPLINWRLATYLPRTEHEQNIADRGDTHDMLNARAVQVTNRIKLKLSGRELDPDRPGWTVSEQVEHLIKEATSHVNLCQAYIGWCPFW